MPSMAEIASSGGFDRLTFGVELETTVPRDEMDFDPVYSNPPRIGAGFWSAKTDSSIRSTEDYAGVEFVTPILSGPEGIASLIAGVRELRDSYCVRSHSSCGIHIHVGIPHDASPAHVLRIVALFARHEAAFLAMTGAPARMGNAYCKRIADKVPNVQTIDDCARMTQPFGSLASSSRVSAISVFEFARDRYHTLNLCPIVGTSERFGHNGHCAGTVEFRLFPSTTNVRHVVTWTRLCVALVHHALTHRVQSREWTLRKVADDSPGRVVTMLRSLGIVPGASWNAIRAAGEIAPLVGTDHRRYRPVIITRQAPAEATSEADERSIREKRSASERKRTVEAALSLALKFDQGIGAGECAALTSDEKNRRAWLHERERRAIAEAQRMREQAEERERRAAIAAAVAALRTWWRENPADARILRDVATIADLSSLYAYVDMLGDSVIFSRGPMLQSALEVLVDGIRPRYSRMIRDAVSFLVRIINNVMQRGLFNAREWSALAEHAREAFAEHCQAMMSEAYAEAPTVGANVDTFA